MIRTLIEMEKACEGFTSVIILSQTNHDQGGKTYDMSIYKDWSCMLGSSCHATHNMSMEKYRNLGSAKVANDCYKQFVQMGYTVTRHDTFKVTDDMDMR